MEVEKMISGNNNNNREDKDEDEDEEVPVVLPGFRFHPTDEELVGFYLRRKVEKKPMNISIHQLIKQIDIYNYDPWDLPKAAAAAAAAANGSNNNNNNNNNVGEKGEWYFYCKRGRKYRNSIRPNRVTASGFWKATGIDRPIYSSDHFCKIIGLKKSLVYYRGTAGKGTKTDWMMHEFRLPPLDHDHLLKTTTAKRKFTNIIPPAQDQQEAEVWTLCRILKRSGSNKKCIPDWREVSSAAAGVKRRVNVNVNVSSTSSKTCTTSTSTSSVEYSDHKFCQQQGYNNISFRADPPLLNIRHINEIKKKPQQQPFVDHFIMNNNNEMMMMNGQMEISQLVSSSISDHERLAPSTTTTAAAEVLSYSSSFSSSDVSYDFLKHGGDWEDDDQLKSFVEFAADPILFV